MRIASAIAFVLFGLAALVQGNDPDSGIWISAYLVAAGTAVAAFFGRVSVAVSAALAVVYGAAAWSQLPVGADLGSLSLSSFGMSSLEVEEMREALGLAIVTVWMVVLCLRGLVVRPGAAAAVVLLACAPLGCSANAPGQSSTVHGVEPDAVEVPETPESRLVPRTRVVTGIENPRGMLPREGGAMLVSVAGSGDPEDGTGALLLFEDRDGDGTFAVDERRVLLGGQVSRNIIDIVRRDEVFGMAGIAEGDGVTLVSLAYFGGPSTIYRVDGEEVRPWSEVFGNINDLAFDPKRRAWMAVSSSSDEVVRLQPDRGSQRILKVPPLEQGQDPVPGYLRHDPRTGDLLVSLFSGSTRGEEGGVGTELVRGSGGVVRVDPDTGDMRWLVRGLTAPTDLEIGPDGRLYVLEFCSHFEDPFAAGADMWRSASHGGFRRFSGRLLAIDRDSGEVEVVAEGLDGPTNLALRGRDLYIAQGMGTPGRPIPGPDGTVPLTGFIEKIELPGPREGA